MLENYKKRLIRTLKLPSRMKLQPYDIEVSRTDKIVTIKRYSSKSYAEIVEDMIKTKYSLAQEVSILRQQYTKIDEYNEYYQFVEQCKALAKEFINERNSIFNR
jgi:hypothetical protein